MNGSPQPRHVDEVSKGASELEGEARKRYLDEHCPDAAFRQAVELLFCCAGRVVVTGMGKSGLIARKIAATLSSTGTPALYLHPVEALHGDLGMIVRGDVVVALSASGETGEILELLATIKRLRVPLITLTGDEICGEVNIRHSRASKGARSEAASSLSGRRDTARFECRERISTRSDDAPG